MSVNIGIYSEDAIASPFDVVDYDIGAQTGGDWYTTMLSASMGNKNVEGVACSGSSEVLMKSSLEFAAKHATGKIRVKVRNKSTPSVDAEGKMVAKLGKKFRGVGKANSFSLIIEDSLWGSASMNRVRSAAFFAASLVAMGVDIVKAQTIASDVLGENLPIDVINAVSVPLSILKRDAAVIAKGRNTVFVPHHLIQDVVWEDGALMVSEAETNAAIDWGRVTAIARYIGVVNTLVDDRFAQFAESYGVPYALINNHWAHVSKEPYLELNDWRSLDHPENPLGSVVDDAHKVAENLSRSARLSVSMMAEVQETPTATLLMKALRTAAPRRAKPKLTIAEGTDVLLPVTAHSISPGNVGMLVKGSESAHNAVVSAMISTAVKDGLVRARLSELLNTMENYNPDEGIIRQLTKEIADRVISAQTFVDARARLGRVIGSDNIAARRVASYRRSLFRNSSALSDRVVLNETSIDTLTKTFKRVAKAVVRGNTGVMLPPPILANPEAAIKSGRAIELIKKASKYLEDAKEYWANRYQTQSNRYAESDTELAVHYGMASKAFRLIRPEWLTEWGNAFLPPECIDNTYIHKAAKSYTRKRSEDQVKIAPMANEGAMAYAKRMDIMLKPKVSFESSMLFVTERIKMLAEDFMANEEFVEPPSDNSDGSTSKPAPPRASAPVLSFLNVVPNLKRVSVEALRVTWIENGDPDYAAKANNYSSYQEASVALGDKCAFDPENEFTKEYFKAKAIEEEEATTAATEQVI